MGYSTPSQVSALDQGREPFTASSKPTLIEVGDFIVNVDSEIDAILAGRGYDVPIGTVASTARGLLGYYSALGADALVQRAAQNSDRRDTAAKAWEDAKALLLTLTLPGVEITGADRPPTSARWSDNGDPIFDVIGPTGERDF